ncbi:hypothetical protein SNEBB_007226 [Seison nebaliae]|nr:hypothetical protein SNEBB_007226 [Seison nebaliae]
MNNFFSEGNRKTPLLDSCPTSRPIKDLYKEIIGQLKYDGHYEICDGLIDLNESVSPSNALFHEFNSNRSLLNEKVNWKNLSSSDETTNGEVKKNISNETIKEEKTTMKSRNPTSKFSSFYHVQLSNISSNTIAFDNNDKSSLTNFVVGDVNGKLHFGYLTSDSNCVIYRIMKENSSKVTSIQYHPSSSSTFVLSGDDQGDICVINNERSTCVGQCHVLLHEVSAIVGLRWMNNCSSNYFACCVDDSPTIRLYDGETLSCYRSKDQRRQPTNELNITSLSSNYSNDSPHLFATGSSNSQIELWDIRTMERINHIDNAHNSLKVNSLQMMKSRTELLSNGLDGFIRVWDLRSLNKPIININNKESSSNQFDVRVNACLNEKEDTIMSVKRSNNMLYQWNCTDGQMIMDPIPCNTPSSCHQIIHHPNVSLLFMIFDDYSSSVWSV